MKRGPIFIDFSFDTVALVLVVIDVVCYTSLTLALQFAPAAAEPTVAR